MSDLFDIPANIAERCLIDPAQYQSMYTVYRGPRCFWSEQAGAFLDWVQPWTQVSEADTDTWAYRLVQGRSLKCQR